MMVPRTSLTINRPSGCRRSRYRKCIFLPGMNRLRGVTLSGKRRTGMRCLRTFSMAMAVAVMCCLGVAAQQADALANARKELEEYRQSKTSTWMNDFGEQGRYHDANAALAST